MENIRKTGIISSGHNRRLLLKRKSDVVFIYVFFIVFIIAANLISSRFGSSRNIRNLVTSNIGLLFAAYAQMFVVISGGVDLSVGSVISVTNVLCVSIINENPATWILAALVSLAAGALIGLVNGLLVVYGGLQPLIATLATQTFFAGTALWIMPGPSGTLPSALCKFITKGWHYTFPILLAILATVAFWILLNRTSFGRYVLAVGGNENSAKSSGISVGKIRISTFVLSGVIAAVAGLYISAFATSGNPLIGEAYSQRSITAAVVGGASLAGGRGSVIGCIAAVGILGIISNILNLTGTSSYYQYVLQGVLLIAALTISALRTNK